MEPVPIYEAWARSASYRFFLSYRRTASRFPRQVRGRSFRENQLVFHGDLTGLAQAKAFAACQRGERDELKYVRHEPRNNPGKPFGVTPAT